MNHIEATSSTYADPVAPLPLHSRARTPRDRGGRLAKKAINIDARSSGEKSGPSSAEIEALEIRVHGRGGQGGVTCAKLIAAVYSEQGGYVQTFGDYASERSGAPVRAYTRVAGAPITNRNKVYRPNHLLVLDPSLIVDEVLEGLACGGAVLLNSSEAADAYAQRFAAYRLAVVDATAIARKHGIGTRSVIIVNTTIVGAYARLLGLPLEAVEKAYQALGLQGDLEAAREAYQAVVLREPEAGQPSGSAQPAPTRPQAPVLALTEHTSDLPSPLKTGSWRTQLADYLDRPAPCNASCPAGNDVVGFIQALNDEGVEAAARILRRTQPLPSVCGRVCPAPCQSGCNRSAYDGALNIRGLERYVADHAADPGEPVKQAANPRRIAVIGGGPAGLSAAYALGREGHQATIFERESQLGGVLRTGIPDYRLPPAQLDRDIERILALGVEVRSRSLLDRTAVETLAAAYDGLIVATGLNRWRTPDCPGEQLAGIEQGLCYLHRVKAAGSVSLQGHVVVVGGGNSAIDCARTALRCGAERVTVVYRRGKAEMPAIAEEIEEALEEGVELLLNRQPLAFTGEAAVTGIELAEVELGEADESGRRRPVITDRVSQLACDKVLLALGQSSDFSLLPQNWQLQEGRIWLEGSALNVFCAGDLATGDGTVTHAIGDGRRAALAALRALGEEVPEFHRPTPETAVPAEEIRCDHFTSQAPVADRLVPARLRVTGFAEANQGLADANEAQRCFSCGRCTGCDTCLVYCPEGVISREGGGYAVDQDYCKGCGICAAECPRQAMRMSAE